MSSNDIADDWVEIKINASDLAWLQEHGYRVPTRRTQTYYTNKKSGLRMKNGVKIRHAVGARIKVRREHLPPASGRVMNFTCTSCGGSYTTRWGAYALKKSKDCKVCSDSQLKTTGCHSYWVKRLITDNPDAKCDISDERDKRFLLLHHLVGRKDGGRNEESNYVTLSANYHHAFHVWVGGTNVSCTPEQYVEFKRMNTH